jgi:ferrous iron transport protein B
MSTQAFESPLVALAGSPNCGKTALFNALTGGRQKVGNYSGVTVERKQGSVKMQDGREIQILDLPGTYSLDARTLDEAVTRDVLLGQARDERAPELLVAVADATNLERNLSLVLELKELNRPVVLALNMMDLAGSRGLELDLPTLSRELGIPVVPTIAVRKQGIQELLQQVEQLGRRGQLGDGSLVDTRLPWRKPTSQEVQERFREIDRILKAAVRRPIQPTLWTDRIDRVVLHPVWGSLFLLTVLTVMFQAIFSWAEIPKAWIEAAIGWLGSSVSGALADGPLKSLLVDGIVAGVGGVLVFLPQILLLFAFILVLEDSGYMARAAFLMDRLMGKVGLNGRSFIPMLSSYACAIPGIMATRTIESRRDRLVTILVAPLTTCSARLPVYTLLIAAFVPLKFQALVMMGLYLGGILAALGVAVLLRRTLLRGPKPALLMELPTYKWPSPGNVFFGLWERARIFVRRAGTVILALSVVVWFLSSYPKPPQGATGPAIDYSYAGRIGHAIEPVIRPIGFDWRVGVALIPGFAAREVMVSALATVYSVEAKDGADPDALTGALGETLRKNWSVATAASLLVWYVLALQCLSTFAVARRETNSWRWPLFMLGYMTLLAYLGSFVTFQVFRALGWG